MTRYKLTMTVVLEDDADELEIVLGTVLQQIEEIPDVCCVLGIDAEEVQDGNLQ